MKSKFITFEGGEGAGKSTQVKMLAEYLRGQGREVVVTREPGGTKNGEEIRNLLLYSDGWDELSEVLLNFAARNEHVKRVIKPALAKGQWVICDRFFDSTTVYQGYGQGVEINKIEEIRMAVLGGFNPDTTFLLDISPETALERATDHNRYEKMGLAFHQKIREGFLELAKENIRFVMIDASKSTEEVHKSVILGLDPRIQGS